MDTYRVCLAAVPPEGKCSVLVLEPWQDEALAAFLDQVLTDAQWRAMDEAVLGNLADLLQEQTQNHLHEGNRP